MLRKSLILVIALLAVGLTFVHSQTGSGDGSTIVPGKTFADKMAWLQAFVQSDNSYVIEISADESIRGGHSFEYIGKNNITITLRGIGANRTISLSSSIMVRSGVTLILDNNITINGDRVYVAKGGTLIMNTGVTILGSKSGGVFIEREGCFIMNDGTISGNTVDWGGGGVSVRGGTFTMSSGSISGNTASESGGGVDVREGIFTMRGGSISGSSASWGGGVSVRSGTFAMSGGSISGNTASSSGGGVDVWGGTFTMSGGSISGSSASWGGRGSGGGVSVRSGTFIMNGGIISGNTARENGGGVFVNDTFTMSGGTIFGNTASENGGGVYVWGSTFTKTGGTITGYGSDTSKGNMVKDSSGTILNYRGHAVYVPASGSRGVKIKETTAGPNDNLSYSKDSLDGAWDN